MAVDIEKAQIRSRHTLWLHCHLTKSNFQKFGENIRILWWNNSLNDRMEKIKFVKFVVTLLCHETLVDSSVCVVS